MNLATRSSCNKVSACNEKITTTSFGSGVAGALSTTLERSSKDKSKALGM